jgi:hypothetical protein
MNKDQKHDITEFFKMVTRMKKLNIIRSDKYLGDIAEFICKEYYDLELENSQRNIGFDAKDESKRKVQIKLHIGQKGNNCIIGKGQFDYLLLLIGPESKIRPRGYPENTWLIYKILNLEGKKSIAKRFLEKVKCDKILDEQFNDITSTIVCEKCMSTQ